MTSLLLILLPWTPAQTGKKEKKKKAAAPPPDAMEMEKINPRGRFEGDIIDRKAGFFLWLEDDGQWHLRTGSKNRDSVFTGKVRVEGGTFKSYYAMGFEKKGKSVDLASINPARNELVFSVKTHGKADGLNFKVDGAEAVLIFELVVNGNKELDRVAIGPNKRHPKQNPFRLPNEPPPQPKGEKSGSPKKKKPA